MRPGSISSPSSPQLHGIDIGAENPGWAKASLDEMRHVYQSTKRVAQSSWSGMTSWVIPREVQAPKHTPLGGDTFPPAQSENDIFRHVPTYPKPTVSRVTRLSSIDGATPVPEIVVVDSPTDKAAPPIFPSLLGKSTNIGTDTDSYLASPPSDGIPLPGDNWEYEKTLPASKAATDGQSDTSFLPDSAASFTAPWHSHERSRSARSARSDWSRSSSLNPGRFFTRSNEAQDQSTSQGDDSQEDNLAKRRSRMGLSPSTWFGPGHGDDSKPPHEQHIHSSEMTDYLDVLDPTIGVFNTLQNMGNSFMIPNIPWLYNRRPAIRVDSVTPSETNDSTETLQNSSLYGDPEGPDPDASVASTRSEVNTDEPYLRPPTLHHDSNSLGVAESQAEDARSSIWEEMGPEERAEYEGHTSRWNEMDPEERAELETHVRHLLSSRSRTKRILRGFFKFVTTPSGFFITVYGLAVTAWGTFIMLLIIKWVHIGDARTNRYWIEICDQVLCALFTSIGLGMAPFRAVDTYRMIFIAHYHFLTYKRRRLLGLPPLRNPNELPQYSVADAEAHDLGDRCSDSDSSKARDSSTGNAPSIREGLHEGDIRERLAALGVRNVDGNDPLDPTVGIENLFGPMPGQPGVPIVSPGERQRQRLQRAPSIQSMVRKDSREVSVLTPLEQSTLQHHQREFHNSHTFYRYAETETHWPFPLRLMMVIVILLDCHSFLQATLGGITWGIYYLDRPTALTATIITCSLSCSAVAGIIIWQGGSRTRKTDVVKRRVRLALEEEAIARMERKRKKAQELEKRGVFRPQRPL